MFESFSLTIKGYENHPVPNTFFRQEESVHKLAVILPGYNPPLIRPPLYYISEYLLSNNTDLLQVEHEYYKAEYPFNSEKVILERLFSDVTAACETTLTQREYSHITIIGKSLGTMAMAHLLDDIRFREASCVWLTPLLTKEYLRSQITRYKPDSLFVIGTADRFYDEGYLSEMAEVTGGECMVIENVNHNLGIESDIQSSIAVLSQIVTRVTDFIS
jgi:hypothetical protein